MRASNPSASESAGSGNAKQTMASNIRNLVNDAEELLRTTSNYSGEGFAAARTKFEERLRELKRDIPDTESYRAYMTAKYRQAATSTDRYVRDNPWQMLGVVAGVAILTGFLFGRR